MSALTSIGQLTALVGMIVFAWSLILSTRIKLFEDYFKGMNGVYIAHHLLGGISFILLMIHPISLALTYLPISYRATALFLLPHEDWTVNLGIASLLCMMALLILTYYVEIPYHFWKFTHKFLGLAFFIGGLHSFFTVFLPVFPFFLFSLLTYFLRDDAFRKWARFAIPATFVSMVLIAITPDSYANGFGPQVSIGKGDAALVLSALFVLISLSIIGRAYLRPASK
jgi:hypothetical protein